MFEGWISPFAEAQRQAEDSNAAWNALKADPGAAALFAGLSMLANNDGRRRLGQLAGQAGVDALAGLHDLQAQRRDPPKKLARRPGYASLLATKRLPPGQRREPASLADNPVQASAPERVEDRRPQR